MDDETYLENLNDSTIRKNDILYANNVQIDEFDPTTMSEEPRHTLFISPTGYGKSTILCDFISKNYKNYDLILIISTTAKRQKIYNWIPRENIIESFDEKLLSSIWNKSKYIGDKYQNVKLPKVLIILDDIINDPEYKKSKILDDLFCYGRQYNITVYILSQNFTSIKLKHRINCMYAVSFNMDTKTERAKFCETYLSLKNNTVADLVYKRITTDPVNLYQAIIVEKYKKSCKMGDKVKKYTADVNIPKFTFKETLEDYNQKLLKIRIAQEKKEEPKKEKDINKIIVSNKWRTEDAYF